MRSFTIFKSWFCRGWILYAALAIAAMMLVDINKLSSHAKPSTLSRLRPHYGFIGAFANGTTSLNRKELEDQKVYLENVNAVMGERPDTDALLGYVLFYLGEKHQAEEMFKRSSQLNPSFFWNYYSLGILAYSRGEMVQSKELLQHAVSLNPEFSAKFVVTSRVFLPLINDSGYSPQKFWDNLIAGYIDSYKLLVAIEFSGQNFEQMFSVAQAGLKISMNDADRVYFLYFVGASALQAGSLPTAAKAFEECLKLDAEHPEALAGMALVLKSIGQQDIASQFLERAKKAKIKNGGGLLKPEELKVRVF